MLASLSHQQSYEILSSFRPTAAPLGLHVSRAKTELQNLGSGPRPAAVSVNGNLVEPADKFVYLGSLQSSDGCCWPDMKRRIRLAASTMSSIHRIWNDKCLSIPTKIRLFQALVLSILLCASETWTLRVADMKTPEAFYVKCLRQILGVRWHQHITNSEILSHGGVGPLAEQIARRHTAASDHIVRLADNVPAHLALRCQIDASVGHLPSKNWKRRPGRPRNRWLDLVRPESNCSLLICGERRSLVQDYNRNI